MILQKVGVGESGEIVEGVGDEASEEVMRNMRIQWGKDLAAPYDFEWLKKTANVPTRNHERLLQFFSRRL